MMCYVRDSNLRRNGFKYLSKKMAHTISYVSSTDKSARHTCRCLSFQSLHNLGGVSDNELSMPNSIFDNIELLLIIGSQLFEGAVGDTEVTEVDELFLQPPRAMN